MDETSPTPAAAQWLLLVQAVTLCGRQLRRALADIATPRGLSDTDCLILWACGHAPAEGHAQHALANMLAVSPAQLSGLVERLSRCGWIVGRRPAHDRRRQYWRLTPTGQVLVEQLIADVARWLDHAPHLPHASTRAMLIAELSRLSASLSPLEVSRSQEAA